MSDFLVHVCYTAMKILILILLDVCCHHSLFRFEGCWPAMAREATGIIFVYNPDQPNHDKDLENWYVLKVQQYAKIFFEYLIGAMIIN